MAQGIIVDLPVFFRALASAQGIAGPIGELTAHLASGEANRTFYEAVVDRHGLRREPWFTVQRLDLLLGFAVACLARRQQFVPEQLTAMHLLRTFLQIEDGELLRHRPAEVAHILRAQLELILADAVVDRDEDLYQVELRPYLDWGTMPISH